MPLLLNKQIPHNICYKTQTNYWTFSQTKATQASPIMQATWSWPSIAAPLILVHPEPEEERGNFFLSSKENFPLNNGLIHNIEKIIKAVVMSSAAKAELRALFINAWQAIAMQATLMEMGHKQPPMPFQTDNLTALGTITNTILPKVTKAKDMQFYWLRIKNNNNKCGAPTKLTFLTTWLRITVPHTIRPWGWNLCHQEHKKLSYNLR